MRFLLQGDHLNAFSPSLTALAMIYSPLLHRSPFPSCPSPNLEENQIGGDLFEQGESNFQGHPTRNNRIKA